MTPESVKHVRAPGCILTLAALLIAVPAFAQQATQPAVTTAPVDQSAAANAENAKITTLDPFQVKTDKDTSYGATSSTSLARFNTELDKTPVTADIFTAQFIEDTGATTLEQLFNGYAGGAGAVLATPESDSTASQPGDRFSVSQFGVRGISAGSPRKDGFQFNSTNTNANTIFDTERVEILHGSQGLLYGATGAGGVINLVSKQAHFDVTQGSTKYTVDQYGTKIANLDINEGASWFAIRGDILQQDNKYRYLFSGDQLQGYYGQMAFKLPANSILRVSAEETHDNRIYNNNTTVNFGGTSVDPRSGDNLNYLLATNQLGAINPATGQAYPGGAIDNGFVTPTNLKSFAGWSDEEDTDDSNYKAVLDSQWTSWLSTSFGAYWDKSQFLRSTNIGNLNAPHVSGPPTALANDWTIGSTLANSESPDRKKEYRGSVLVTNDLFGGIAHSQSSIGFDRAYDDSSGGIAYIYYQANSDGSITINPAASNLGRVAAPTTYWSVNNGPVLYALPKVGAQTISLNGILYTRQPSNPRGPQWVTANNPLGLASLYPGITGVSGGNSGGFAQQQKNQGWYLANYTSWWNDRVDTFLGFRESNAFTRSPNTSTSIQAAYIESRSKNYPSYNAGADFTILSWLRGYVEYSRTFDTTVGSNDPYGDIPKNPTGYTYEGGLKFDQPNIGLSGSLSAYTAYSENDNYNAGTTFENVVNPAGLNGAFVGPQGSRNQWAQFNKQSNGLELLLTAQPTHNWRLSFKANAQQATVESNSVYPMLYNDQFRVDNNGNVVYANGNIVMVPTDAAGLALVAKQTTAINMANPASTAYASSTFVPLTVAMINNTASPYFAFGSGTLPQNEPINGSIGGPTGGSQGTQYLKNVLANFQSNGTTALTGATGLPFSDIQYNFADPAGYQGVYTVQRKGDKAVGTPAISMNVTNTYTFSQGWLNGLGLGGSVGSAWYYQSFYYGTPDHVRHLFYAPTAQYSTVNTWLFYSRKFGKIVWKSQLNINGMFNHYDLALNPNNGTGFTNPANVTASIYGTPRNYVWSNTINF